MLLRVKTQTMGDLFSREFYQPYNQTWAAKYFALI